MKPKDPAVLYNILRMHADVPGLTAVVKAVEGEQAAKQQVRQLNKEAEPGHLYKYRKVQPKRLPKLPKRK